MLFKKKKKDKRYRKVQNTATEFLHDLNTLFLALTLSYEPYRERVPSKMIASH